MTTAAIYIGTSPEVIREAVKVTSLILKSKVTDKTKQVAFEFLMKSTKAPEYTTISGCNINMKVDDEY